MTAAIRVSATCPRCGRELVRSHDELLCLVHGLIADPRRAWDAPDDLISEEEFARRARSRRRHTARTFQPWTREQWEAWERWQPGDPSPPGTEEGELLDERLVFEVSLPYRELSSNGSHGHWRAKASARRDYREEARLAALVAMAEQDWRPPGRVRVHFVFALAGGRRAGRYQPRDVGNAIAAVKPLVDGMVDAGVMPDDSRRWLVYGQTSITSADGPFVRVTVEPV